MNKYKQISTNIHNMNKDQQVTTTINNYSQILANIYK